MSHNELEQQIEVLSQPLRARLAERIVLWEWDAHTQALQGAFSVDHKDAVWAILEEEFPHIWSSKNLRSCPPETRQQARHFARLQKQQKLLCGYKEPALMAAWWPWGHGATVSLRLFLADTRPYQPAKGVRARLASFFGKG